MWLSDFLLKRKQLIFLVENWETIKAFERDEKISNTEKILDWKDKKKRRDELRKTNTIRGTKIKRTWE